MNTWFNKDHSKLVTYREITELGEDETTNGPP